MPARPPRLMLQADTAADLMAENPISVPMDAPIQEAIALMTDRGYHAAPVIDDGGRPVGVVSVTDILIHNREFVGYLKRDTTADADLREHGKLPEDMGIEVVDRTTVGEIMTPTVFTIRQSALAGEVVQAMKTHHVHHLFVSDDSGVLVGVISAGDLVRKLG